MNAVTFVPRLQLEVEGSPLDEAIAGTLSALRVQHRLSQPSLCELTFTSVRGSLDAASALTVGKMLKVDVTGQDDALFAGQVTGVEYLYTVDGERQIRVRAYDLLHRLRKNQTVRAHVQVSVRDLAAELVSGTGLSVEAMENGPMWPHLVQHRQSDFELLVTAAERCGLYLTIRDDTLHLLTLEGKGDPVSLTLGQDLIEARVELNADAAVDKVTAVGWNPALVEAHDGNAASARSGRSVGVEVFAATVGGGQSRALVDEVAPTDDHADGLARAELDRRVARTVVFHGLAEGNAALHPGRPVEIEGLATEICGTYIVTSVIHTFDSRSGFLSELSSEPPVHQARTYGAFATIGVVTRVDDPQGLARVCVKMPAYDDIESPWLGVVLPAAGPAKGLIALPDVEDKVLVVSLDGDPSRGFVIGGLYGTTEPPDTGVVGGTVKRFTFKTAGGQFLRLDDEGNLLRVETDGGSYVEIAPSSMRIHAESDLTIEAPGKRVRIRGQAIDFERG